MDIPFFLPQLGYHGVSQKWKKKKKKRERKVSATYSIFFVWKFSSNFKILKIRNFLSHFDSDFAFVAFLKAFLKAVLKTVYTSSKMPTSDACY